MRTVMWLLLVMIFGFNAAYAQTEEAWMGNALVVVRGNTVTVNTGLPCDQRTYQVPTYESDYKQIFLAIDNETEPIEAGLQKAYNAMRSCESRLINEPESKMGMVNDFRLWLCSQPGLPTEPAFYFNGKFEEIAGNPEQFLTPAWCLRNYGVEFLNEEFGIGTPSNMREVKFYPRWETSGDQGLKITFSNGKMVIHAPMLENDYPWMYPYAPDYGDIATVEEIYYLPSKDARPLVRFAVRVLPSSVSLGSEVNLPLVSNSLGEGYAVPLLEGNRQLVIPFSVVEPVAAFTRTSRITNLPQKARSNEAGLGGPVSLPQFLRPIITPGFPAVYAGQTYDTWNPPDRNFVMCDGFPIWLAKKVVAIPENTYYEITSKGSKKITFNKEGLVIGVQAPIKGIPTKAQIDVEVGKTQQDFANGDVGYYESGPVYYNERKYQWYKIKFHWVAVSSADGGFSWHLEWYQKTLKSAREREYIKNDRGDSARPFTATLTNWRSKAWFWVPASGHLWWYKPGHWELRPVHWPTNYGLTMMIWNGATPDNPEGICEQPTRIPPIPIFKKQ